MKSFLFSFGLILPFFSSSFNCPLLATEKIKSDSLISYLSEDQNNNEGFKHDNGFNYQSGLNYQNGFNYNKGFEYQNSFQRHHGRKPCVPTEGYILLSQQLETPATRLIRLLTQAYFNKQAITNIMPDLSLKDGYLIQRGLVSSLSQKLGKPVGYKVGLTNAIAQNKLQVNHPVMGILLKEMLLKNGAKVKADFGAIPRIEGDLIVRVSSDQINQAKTPEDVIKSLDQVIPFLELPDLMFDKDVKLSAGKLVAVNVGARLGIMGKPIVLKDKEKWRNQLKQIRVTIKNSTGKELGTGNSDSLLNDPLNVVIWLRDELKSQGKTLKKGDLISLGSMTTFIPITAGQTIQAYYWGLEKEKPITLTVTFTK